MNRPKIIITILLSAIILLSTTIILNVPSSVSARPNLDFNKIYRDPLRKLDPEIIKLLSSNTGSRDEYINVIMVVDPDSKDFSKIVKGRLTPKLPGDIALFLARVKLSDIMKLAKLPSVGMIILDRKLNYDESNIVLRSEDLEEFKGGIEPNMYFIRDLLGASKVESEFNITGEGVVVAVTDTGVDFAHPDLTDALARNGTGYPFTFDPDGNGLSNTSTVITPISIGGKVFLNTSNYVLPWIYAFWGPYVNWGGTFTPKYDIDITQIDASVVNKNYHVGVLIEYIPVFNMENWTRFGLVLPDGFPGTVFNVVVADKNGDGVYETLYVDLSTTWDILVEEGILPGPTTGRPLFTIEPDEEFYLGRSLGRPLGGEIIAADYNGDGVPDFSAGSISGYFIDVLDQLGLYNLGILPGIDPNGNFIDVLYDWVPHGTNCAASIASRGVLNHFVVGELPGIARDAKIMAVQALSWGNVFDGWLWASGFDLIVDPTYGFVWVYTGNHKADVNSNSWGISQEAYDGFGHGYDFFSLMENFLVAFTDTVFVHALGNGGFGYGTITSSGASAFAIGVGASTTFHYMPLFGYAFGKQDQIVSWSARGPTTVGYVKPDVVNVGAFGVTPTALWLSRIPGNGISAWSFFGGTSFATPLTAGVVALIIQAWRTVYGVSPTPDIVKRLVMNTATDLGFDPFQQGAGRANAYAAVSAIMSEVLPGLKKYATLVSSPTTWDKISEEIWWSSTWYGWPMPETTLLPVSIYFGTVDLRGSATAILTLENIYSGITQTVNINAYRWVREITFDVQFSYTVPGVSSYWITPDDAPALNRLKIMKNRLWRIFVQYSFDVIDANRNYVPDRLIIVDLYDWVDDGDGVLEPTELKRINYSALDGDTQMFFVYTKPGLIEGKPVLRIRQYIYPTREATEYISLPLMIRLTPYLKVKVPPSQLKITPSSVTVAPGATKDVKLILKPVSMDGYGVFEGIIEVVNNYGQKAVIPFSYSVAPKVKLITKDIFLKGSLISELIAQKYPYMNMRLTGAFDWGWRYESGDWRMFKVNIADPTVVSIIADVKWPGGDRTDINVHGFIAGALSDQSYPYYIGSGRFVYYTRTGVNRDFVVISPTTSLTAPGFYYYTVGSSTGPIYTLRLQNVLLDRKAPIWYDIKIGTIRLKSGVPKPFYQAPWFTSPTWWVVDAKAGSKIYAVFTIETGVKLKNLQITSAPWANLTASFKPSTIPLLIKGGKARIAITINVPSGLAPGTYFADFMLFAENYPDVPVAIFRVDVNVS